MIGRLPDNEKMRSFFELALRGNAYIIVATQATAHCEFIITKTNPIYIKERLQNE